MLLMPGYRLAAPRAGTRLAVFSQASAALALVQVQVSRTTLILLSASICASTEVRFAPMVSTLRCVAPTERQAAARVAHVCSPPHTRRTPDCASIPTASAGLPAALV